MGRCRPEGGHPFLLPGKGYPSVAGRHRFEAKLRAQDPVDFGHGLGVVHGAMVGGRDGFRLGGVEVRTPIRHDPVGTMRTSENDSDEILTQKF